MSNLNIETLTKLSGVIIIDGGRKFLVLLYESLSNYSALFINEYNYIRDRAKVGSGTFFKIDFKYRIYKITD